MDGYALKLDIGAHGSVSSKPPRLTAVRAMAIMRRRGAAECRRDEA
jgi:hypothetical protein